MEGYPRPLVLHVVLIFLGYVFLLSHVGGATEVRTDAQTTAVEGGDIQLTCTYHPHTSPQDFGYLTWEKNNERLLTYECERVGSCSVSPSTAPSRYALNVDTISSGNLTIRGVTLEDEASYKCVVFTSDLVPYSSNTALVVNVPPSGLEISDFRTSSYVNNSVVRIQVNQSYQLKCATSLDGKPAGTITWESDGVAMVTKDQVNEASPTDSRLMSSYRIVDVTPTIADSGKVLRCLATHPSLTGYLIQTVVLDVQDCPSSVMVHSCPTSVVAGDSATLGCRSASTSPPPALYLKFEGVRVDNGTTELQSTVTEDGASELMYTKTFSKLDYNKEFVCCIERTSMCQELCSAPCQPNVQYPPSNPRIEWSVSSDGIVEGAINIEVNCTADGNPMALSSVTWTKVEGSGSTETWTGPLRFASVRRGDAGRYRCTVDNGIPPVEVAETILKVLHGPNITNKQDQVVHGNEGSSAVLTCNVAAYPEPTITWFAPGNRSVSESTDVEITTTISRPNEYLVIVRSSLRISNIDPESNYGHYRCVAINDHGIDHLVVSLSGLSKPAPPTNLRINTALTSDTSLSLTWQAGNDGGAAQTFTITSCLQETQDMCTVYRGIGEETFTITDLMPFTLYSISVVAVNEFGQSEPRPSLKNSTAPLSPQEFGVHAVYDTNAGVVRVRTDENSPEVPGELCFHLVVKVISGQREDRCLKVGEDFSIRSDVSESQLWMVACGRGVCGSADQVTFQNMAKLGETSSPGSTDVTTLAAIICAAVVCVIIIIIIFAAWKWNKKKGIMMFHQRMSSRTLPRTPCGGGPPSPAVVDPMDSPDYAGVNRNSYTYPYATSTLLLSRSVDPESNPPSNSKKKKSQSNGGLTADTGKPMFVQIPGTYTTTLHQYIPMTPVIAVTTENGGGDPGGNLAEGGKYAVPSSPTCASDVKNNNSDPENNSESYALLAEADRVKCDPKKETSHYLVPKGTKAVIPANQGVDVSDTTVVMAV